MHHEEYTLAGLTELYYRKILEKDPNNADISHRLGILLSEQCRYEEAEQILSNTNIFYNVNIQFSLGVLYLGQGKYDLGWSLYQRCWTINLGEEFSTRKFARMPSSLNEVKNKNILLYHDLGLGDSIMFARYIPLVKKYAKNVSVLAPYPLVRLFQQMDDEIKVIESNENNTDYEIGLSNLPALFGTTYDNIPNDLPYFNVTKEIIQHHKLSKSKNLKVGIVWSGLARDIPELKEMDNLRSIKLSNFDILADISNVDFYSLQLGEPLSQTNNSLLGKKLKIVLDPSFDFLDTTSIISQLDLVISVDTSVCHLSAALGVETWILNRKNTCWRWRFDDRTDSNWYPKVVKLYRQKTAHDWSDVILEIKKDLEHFIHEERQ